MSASTPFGLIGAVLGGLGVAAGAFGAHGLRETLTPRMLEIWHTAADYQLVHALALLAVALFAERRGGRAARVAGWAFVFGVVVFSGTLYALALSDVRALGAITPIGGTALIVGWGALAWSLRPTPS